MQLLQVAVNCWTVLFFVVSLLFRDSPSVLDYPRVNKSG